MKVPGCLVADISSSKKTLTSSKYNVMLLQAGAEVALAHIEAVNATTVTDSLSSIDICFKTSDLYHVQSMERAINSVGAERIAVVMTDGEKAACKAKRDRLCAPHNQLHLLDSVCCI